MKKLIELTFQNFQNHVKVGDSVIVNFNGETYTRQIHRLDKNDPNSFFEFTEQLYPSKWRWNYVDEGIKCFVEIDDISPITEPTTNNSDFVKRAIAAYSEQLWAKLETAVCERKLGEVESLLSELKQAQ